MLKYRIIMVFFLILGLSAFCHSGKPDSEIKELLIENGQLANVEDLNFLKAYNGEYAQNIKLFSNLKFTTRLKMLIGTRYKMVKDTCQVEVPIVIENSQFIAEACQPHNCSSTNYIIIYDFQSGILYAGIRKEDVIRIFSENGRKCQKITDWVNN